MLVRSTFCERKWVFPIIMVPPKSSILIGFFIIFTIHFGGPSLFLETSTSAPTFFNQTSNRQAAPSFSPSTSRDPPSRRWTDAKSGNEVWRFARIGGEILGCLDFFGFFWGDVGLGSECVYFVYIYMCCVCILGCIYIYIFECINLSWTYYGHEIHSTNIISPWPQSNAMHGSPSSYPPPKTNMTGWKIHHFNEDVFPIHHE